MRSGAEGIVRLKKRKSKHDTGYIGTILPRPVYNVFIHYNICRYYKL